MEAQNKIVKKISNSIGITNKTVINQAMEYLRLLIIKTNLRSINEYPRIVMCLDISATKANETISIDDGLKLINYGKVKYRNEKNTILRILDISTQAPSVKSLCLALKLTKIKDVEMNAKRILAELKKSNVNLLGEISHPQNACMAVHFACKGLGVKVDERKLIDQSRLNPKQWTHLKAIWCPWLEKIVPTPRTNGSRAPPLLHAINKAPYLRACENNVIESYVVWKKRILEKAYADLALLKKKPRRSNWKTKK